MRVESTGSRCFAVVESSPSREGSPFGVRSSAPSPCSGKVRAPAELCSRTALRLAAARWMDPCPFFLAHWCKVWIHGQRSLGCVPGRYASSVFFYCGSLQSLCAMGLRLAWVSTPPSLDSGALVGGGRRRRRPWKQGNAKGSKDHVVIFFSSRAFCAKLVGQLSFCTLLEVACTCTVPVYYVYP